jgi:putative two-component system response regulator
MAHETLLIVEDNHELRLGLKEMLTFEGYTVLSASNGMEALEQMKSISPDLIVSDVTMPGMDGFEFFEAVRSRIEGISIPFIFLSARGDREDVMRGRNLGAEDYLVKPLTRAELLAAIQARLTRFRQIQIAQLEQSYQTSLMVLANAIEGRDRYTFGHVERVTEYAVVLANRLGWQGRRVENLRFGAILHDVGKIFVDENILKKVKPLTDTEWAEIYEHPIRGAELLKDIHYLAPAIPIVRHHHERWDGRGYPSRLVGDEIPHEARIVTVADAFDAMTTTRSYHPAWPLEHAFEEIQRGSGIIYDPGVVAAFIKCWTAKEIQRIAGTWDEGELPEEVIRMITTG